MRHGISEKYSGEETSNVIIPVHDDFPFDESRIISPLRPKLDLVDKLATLKLSA
jgi:hypothetical protein